MVRWISPLVALWVLAMVVVAADDAKGQPLGSWTRTHGENTVKFEFKADAMKVTLMDGAGNGIFLDATYTG